MRNLFVILPLFSLLLVGCQQDENFPKASTPAVSNTTTSTSNAIGLTPTGWRFYVDGNNYQRNPNNYQQNFVNGNSTTTSPIGSTGLVGLPTKTSSYTLGMGTSTIKDTASFCYWRYDLYPPTSLRMGQTLTLKARIKLADVLGPGISLVIRGDKGSQNALLFSSIQDKTPIRGTADFVEYSVSLPYTQPVDAIAFFLVTMPKTTGTATFSDVSFQTN